MTFREAYIEALKRAGVSSDVATRVVEEADRGVPRALVNKPLYLKPGATIEELIEVIKQDIIAFRNNPELALRNLRDSERKLTPN